MTTENNSRLRAALRVMFRRETWAWWLWACYGIGIVLSRLNENPWPGQVCVTYFRAGADLLAGRPLYADPGEGAYFVYLPPAAALFVPFSLGPYMLMASLWRLINLAVFAAGIFGLSNMKRTDGRSVSFFQVSIIVGLLSTSASRHGQLTLTIAGLLMLAAARLEQQRLWPASFFMALSVVVKPLGLPFLLLAAVVKPGTVWRMLLLFVVLAIPPFLAQPRNFGYVLDQYAQVPSMLGASLERKEGGDSGSKEEAGVEKPRDPKSEWDTPSLFGFLTVWGIWVSNPARSAVRVGLAVAVFLVYLVGRSRLREGADRSLLLYGIAMGYILLLSPATERNTYALLAPVTGILWCLARSRKLTGIWITVGLVVLIQLSSSTMLDLFPEVGMAYMIKFICAVVVLGILLFGPLGVFRRPRNLSNETL